jgi:hypothetical protein
MSWAAPFFGEHGVAIAKPKKLADLGWVEQVK